MNDRICPLGGEHPLRKDTAAAAKTDIQEHKPDHKSADQAEAWFHSLLDTAIDGIIVTDDNGYILAFNKACEELFGYSSSEIMGQGISKIMPRSEAAHHGRHLTRYLETGKKRIIGIGRELNARRRDGSEFPIELSIGEANTNTGRQFIGIIRDISWRKQSEARQRQLQHELEHLARLSAMNELGAAIAHELNQPLTAIMLYMQAATRNANSSGLDDDIRDILEKAASEAERAGKILRGMRRFVEKGEVERRAVSIDEVIHEAVDLMSQSLIDKGIELHFSLDEKGRQVNAEPVQIQQILVNLIRNAVDALKHAAEKKILIETLVRDKTIEVAVEDSGPGLDEDIRPNLFRAFSTSGNGGMGLGLAISRSIARRHDGELTAAASSGDRGARFILSLPLMGREEQHE